MKDYVEKRTLALADCVIETKATIREVAPKFGISKTVAHRDLRVRETH